MRPAVAAALVLVPALGVLAHAQSGDAQQLESYDARDLSIERFVGVLEVETGGVERVEAVWDAGEGLIDAPRFEVRGDRLEVSQLRRRERGWDWDWDSDCRGDGQDLSVEVGREGRHPIADYGRLRVRIPEGAHVEIAGGVLTGTVGDVGELEVGLGSCGDLTVGNVAGDAEVAVNGAGAVKVGAIGGGLSLAVNGSGSLVTGPVAGGLEAAVNGSGDAEIASVEDDIEAAINGSGDIHVLGGTADSIEASIMGSGQLRFDGTAENVELSAFGSGDVYVAEVTGDVTTSAFGSGRVHVGNRDR
jgi:hypothetical protein